MGVRRKTSNINKKKGGDLGGLPTNNTSLLLYEDDSDGLLVGSIERIGVVSSI